LGKKKGFRNGLKTRQGTRQGDEQGRTEWGKVRERGKTLERNRKNKNKRKKAAHEPRSRAPQAGNCP